MGLFDNNNVTLHVGNTQVSLTREGDVPDRPEREVLHNRSAAPSKHELRAESGKQGRKSHNGKDMYKEPKKGPKGKPRHVSTTISTQIIDGAECTPTPTKEKGNPKGSPFTIDPHTKGLYGG
jgi:hypothetical protein